MMNNKFPNTKANFQKMLQTFFPFHLQMNKNDNYFIKVNDVIFNYQNIPLYRNK